MYSVCESSSGWWVEYDDDGVILRIPYHSKAKSYFDREEDSEYEAMETGYFDKWIYEYSNKDRKETKRVFNVDADKEIKKYFSPLQFVTLQTAMTVAQSCAQSNAECVANTTEETEMNTETMETTQRQYLKRRARDVFYKRDNELTFSHGLRDDPYPDTGEELIERIKEGKYILLDKSSRPRYDGPMGHIKWRHPDRKEDQEGYETSFNKLKTMLTATEDSIVVDPLPDAKKALQKFEKESVH